MLLTPEWCQFLKKHNFMVGISLNGPKEIHNLYRRDRQGKGSFDQVMRGLKLLQEHKVKYNVLACVIRFDGNLGGDVILIANWTIREGQGKKIVRVSTSRIQEPTGGPSYESMVEGMSRAIEKMSREIAEAIKSLPP
jgi:hypothetical protein